MLNFVSQAAIDQTANESSNFWLKGALRCLCKSLSRESIHHIACACLFLLDGALCAAVQSRRAISVVFSNHSLGI